MSRRLKGNALRTQFPETHLYACHFHFCQAVRRRAAEIGMAPTISSDEKVRHLYMCFQSIPLLPVVYINEAFDHLSSQALASELHREEWSKFVSYYKSQWLRKERPASISVNNACMRTTSAVESINHKLANSMLKHSSLFTFLHGLTNEATALSRLFNDAIATGGISRTRRGVHV